MTDEQIKQNAEEYASTKEMHSPRSQDVELDKLMIIEDYIAGAHSRDEEIKELQKDVHDFEQALACAEDVVDIQRKELKQLRNPWISVEERLPEEPLTICAVWLKGDDLVPRISLYDSGRFLLLPVDVTVTHWMPIPETPLNK